MNFSIHIDDRLAEDLTNAVKKCGKTRNALINEALRDYLKRKTQMKWPQEVTSLAGSAKDLEPFETHRKELGSPRADPFE